MGRSHPVHYLLRIVRRAQKRIRCSGTICKYTMIIGEHNISVNEIRRFKGFETLTEEQAKKLADFLAFYSITIYKSMK